MNNFIKMEVSSCNVLVVGCRKIYAHDVRLNLLVLWNLYVAYFLARWNFTQLDFIPC